MQEDFIRSLTKSYLDIGCNNTTTTDWMGIRPSSTWKLHTGISSTSWCCHKSWCLGGKCQQVCFCPASKGLCCTQREMHSGMESKGGKKKMGPEGRKQYAKLHSWLGGQSYRVHICGVRNWNVAISMLEPRPLPRGGSVIQGLLECCFSLPPPLGAWSNRCILGDSWRHIHFMVAQLVFLGRGSNNNEDGDRHHGDGDDDHTDDILVMTMKMLVK